MLKMLRQCVNSDETIQFYQYAFSVVLFVFKVHATHTRDFIYVVCDPYKTRIYSLNHNVNSILSTVFVHFYASV